MHQMVWDFGCFGPRPRTALTEWFGYHLASLTDLTFIGKMKMLLDAGKSLGSTIANFCSKIRQVWSTWFSTPRSGQKVNKLIYSVPCDNLRESKFCDKETAFL